MRALVKTTKDIGLSLEDIPEPTMGPADVKIKIKKTAICGTDLHIYKSDPWPLSEIPLPMNIGHEYVGEIVAIGDEVHNFKVGERVSGEGHIICEWCRNCRAGRGHLCLNTKSVGVTRPGAFADFLVIPAKNAFSIPDWMSDDNASILDPLGNAVHTALAFNLVAEDVLVTGAGPIGIMAALVAKFVGSRHVVITDVNETRLELARKAGVKHAVNPTKTKLKDFMQELNMTEGFDVGLEMSGNANGINDMISAMNNGGNMALLGISADKISVDWNQVVLRGLTLKGIYGRRMFETWYKMTNLLEQGLDVSGAVTDHYPAEDFKIAFEKMLQGNCGKIILDW